MSLIKESACVALANFLEESIPSIEGKVFYQAADEEELAKFPSVVILPNTMKFTPWIEDELDDSDPTRLIASVGDFEGTVEIRVYAKSPRERAKIEQRIVDTFLAREGAPGVIVAQTEPLDMHVAGGGEEVTLYSASVAYTLSDETWHEERVFDKKRFDYMEIEMIFPALVARNVYDIDTLEVAIAFDLNASTADEVVIVNDDGSLTQG